MSTTENTLLDIIYELESKLSALDTNFKQAIAQRNMWRTAFYELADKIKGGDEI